MNEIKNVYIHIGIPKTGTTSLQKSLSILHNSGDLAKYDFSYQDDFWYEWLDIETSDNENFCPKNELIKKIQNIISNDTKKNIILSSEMFSVSIHEKIYIPSHKYASIFYTALQKHNVKIVLYLRRQDKWVESFWAQFIKSGIPMDFETFKRNIQPHIFWSEMIKEYENMFGKENLIIKIYDLNLLHKNSIVYDFFNLIGLNSLQPPTLDENQKNTSLNSDEIIKKFAHNMLHKIDKKSIAALILENNKQFTRGQIDKKLYLTKKFSYNFEFDWFKTSRINFTDEEINNFLKTYDIEKLLPMTKNESTLFIEKYHDDNQKIARKYVPNVNDYLFD